MDLLDRTKEICKLYDIWPSRSKGQNFLIEESVYDKVVAAADLSKDDTVLEVGPGLGFLTAKLAKAAGRVIAVELDDKLAAYLKDAITSGETENVEIFNENILYLDLKNTKYEIRNTKYKIVANLPYNITSIFLRKFLSGETKPETMTLLLQKEVAERICAKPGKMSLLALSVQFYAEPEIIDYVPSKDFWPAPKVDSAIIQLRIKNEKLKISGEDEKSFFRMAKIGFSAKRKMLKNNLANGLHVPAAEVEKMLVEAGFNPKIRAEDLGVEDWKKIVEQVTSNHIRPNK
ncbi:MAG: 16S rRNA (adenine(1518)-N(6)/adenine(1519)-N(6))-dimethyltransferase RsmA [Patescibacteria group bacterium]|nr:16S rRNA (adenine(1518)-N(6)/adenine(1519)-N(6))-dimethyltransferase RsmA [Patescibacteria group bacterium]